VWKAKERQPPLIGAVYSIAAVYTCVMRRTGRTADATAAEMTVYADANLT
jgi:hypothetical protein